jgi:hypothetical protein
LVWSEIAIDIVHVLFVMLPHTTPTVLTTSYSLTDEGRGGGGK